MSEPEDYAAKMQRLLTDARERADVAEAQLAAARTRLALLRDMLLGSTCPWPLSDVLDRLATSADHLLHHHGCDGHGHEETQRAALEARKYANAIRAARWQP